MEKMKIIRTKQIAFNIADPIQKELYEYVCKFKNFSRYGKKLINKEINGDWKVAEENEEIEITKDVFSNFI